MNETNVYGLMVIHNLYCRVRSMQIDDTLLSMPLITINWQIWIIWDSIYEWLLIRVACENIMESTFGTNIYAMTHGIIHLSWSHWRSIQNSINFYPNPPNIYFVFTFERNIILLYRDGENSSSPLYSLNRQSCVQCGGPSCAHRELRIY